MAHFTKRPYTDLQKATVYMVLAMNNGNRKKTAKQCGVGRRTLQRWLAKPASEAVVQSYDEQRTMLAGMFLDFAVTAIGVMPDRVEKATLPQLSIASAVAVDKALLLLGRTIDGVDPSRIDEEIEKELARLGVGSTPVIEAASEPLALPAGDVSMTRSAHNDKSEGHKSNQ